MKIALSIGHYFKMEKGDFSFDIGAMNAKHQITEAEVVFDIRHKLIGLLRSTSIEIIEIPKASLQERIRILNCLHQFEFFDLAIEIHMNAVIDKKIYGSEVLYCPGSIKGKQAASEILAGIMEIAGLKNRGIKERPDLGFLTETLPPAVITEADFISNNGVAKRLKTGNLISRIAMGHALGILNLADK